MSMIKNPEEYAVQIKDKFMSFSKFTPKVFFDETRLMTHVSLSISHVTLHNLQPIFLFYKCIGMLTSFVELVKLLMI